MSAVKDETGNRYGKLLVIRKRLDPEQQSNRAYWICQCDCGNKRDVKGSDLRSEIVKSCGCVRQTKYDRGEDLYIHSHIYRTIPQGESVVMSWRERHANWLRGGSRAVG
jgi:hypothetical protein